eukprot:TRINITY_DN1520_c1_g1_i1.p1 TRINITY_DN1520_c1_g1~~TRINITY_DN1520_c1_g1_i1.p1  ORF type:complete len:529 (+),score=66.90 TRINITY_DN1520_c1_g1_i1:37-1623(+)
MSGKPVVAIVGIGCENATFSPQLTELVDFHTSDTEEHMKNLYTKMVSVSKGQKLDLTNSIPPMNDDFSKLKLRYACRYRAMPGGVISKEAYSAIKASLIQSLNKIKDEEGTISGVWLDYHGAMNAQETDDVEGELSVIVRDIVGKECLICASFDLHGNFSEKMRAVINITTAYRTAPHVDVFETRVRALYLLMQAILSPASSPPVVAYLKVPLVVSGEMSNTAYEPCKTIYGAVLEEADADSSIIDASILIGYCWADEPRSGCSVLVTHREADSKSGMEHAKRIANEIWSRRSEFVFPVPSGNVEWCIDEAVSLSKSGSSSLTIISDSGDNPTAGGVGDTPTFVRQFVQNYKQFPLKTLVQGPVDKPAVSTCLKHTVGETITLPSLGAVVDTRNEEPLKEAEFIIRYCHQSVTEYDFNYEGMTYQTTMPPTVILSPVSSPNVEVVVCSSRKPLHYFADFEQLQRPLKGSSYDLLVIKIGYLVPDLEAVSTKNLLALSPGAVYADLPTLKYERLPRPFYPKDPDMEWST